ncbi:Flp family type IVb pilin [bacterium]|nr:Flp family type IVb pilin [bacterium]
MKAILKRFHGEESGASLVEYGLLVGLIAVAAILAVTALGGSISTLFSNVSGSIPA